MALYAAYGSNLDADQMRSRCPHSPFAGFGWLSGWRLTFGGEEHGWDGSIATVVEDPSGRVFVALYDLMAADERTLDDWEGANIGLYKKIRLRVSAMEGDMLAWVYVLDGYEGGLPSARYLSMMADAAEKAGAPADYVSELAGRPCRATDGTP